MHADNRPDGPAAPEPATAWPALRRAIRDSTLSIGLLHLPTMRFVEMSAPATALLGLEDADLASVDAVTMSEEPENTRRALELVADGVIDGYQTRRKLRGPADSCIQAYISVRVIARDDGSEHDLAVFDGFDPSTDDAGMFDSEAVLVVGIVDGSQHVESVSTDVAAVAGQSADEITLHPLLDLVHPDDMARALAAFEAANQPDTQTSVVVRARDGAGGWRLVRLAVARFGDDTGRYGFALGPEDTGPPAITPDRVTELEYRLRRIAREIEAAGIIEAFDKFPDLEKVPGLRDLTARQWEIISRLLRGERVPTIARQMYLSQSTIRNHLASIFRKVGVHSQPELLELLHGGSTPTTGSASTH